jgi:hypothetical protein
MTSCDVQASGAVELYYYDELSPAERAIFDAHLPACRHCRAALADLAAISAALAERPVVSAPPSGDWAPFMARLEQSIGPSTAAERAIRAAELPPAAPRPSYLTYLAMAALLALVTVTVMMALRPTVPAPVLETAATGVSTPAAAPASEAADFRTLSEEHFDRSKLVVLGLATKDPRGGDRVDWDYERSLATSLLNDTRMYRLAAEDRGLTALAGVMRDLELVLLQTSLTDETDPDSLPQLQRLIRKRDLLEKMDVVTTTGL